MATVTLVRDAVRGTVILFLGNTSSTVILAVTAIITARLLGPDRYGLYTLVLLIPNIFYLLVGFGVNSALTRFPAYYLAKGDRQRATRFTTSAIIFLFVFGLLLTLITIFVSSYIGIVIFHRQGLGLYLEEAALSIFGQTVLLSTVAALVGWNSMNVASASLIGQALLKLILVVGLIFLGFGVSGALLGYFGAFIITGFLALAVLFVTSIKVRIPSRANLLGDIKQMMSYGLPLYVGNVVCGFSVQLITVIVAIIATNVVVGDYQAASNITLAVSLLGSALASSLGRGFSALDGSQGNIKSAFRLSAKYVGFFVTPLILFVVPTSQELMDLLYGSSYAKGEMYLQIFALSYVPVCIGLAVLGPYFGGIGKSRLAMYFFLTNALAILLSLPFFIYALNYGVLGTIYSLALGNFASCVVGLLLAKKFLATRIDLNSSIGVLLASSLACGCVYLIIPILAFTNAPLGLLIQLAVLIIVYSSIAPMFSAIDANDIQVLSTLIENSRILRKTITPFLTFEETIIEMKAKILSKSFTRISPG